jgi:DNA repair protein SbcC/Rad50
VHISRIELENIKSYASRSFEFARGTTAITGENGAGKTTLIESVAWVLFDLLEYKKDDFVRRGEKKGSVRVTLISGLDEREYVVFRDTAAGYHVIDSQLGIRIADKKEEVTRFLWQHLGLEPGTDLRSLFRQAIGVPQGTLTAIFLEGHAERKAAFDRLLKVEEYRQASEKLRDTSRFLDSSISAIREKIARAEGELGRTEIVAEEHAVVSAELKNARREREDISRAAAKARASEAVFAEAARSHAQAKIEVEKARFERERAYLAQQAAQRELRQAMEAAEIVATVTVEAAKHTDATSRMKALESEREKRDALRSRKLDIERRLIESSSEIERLNDRLARSLASAKEIEQLVPKVVEQERIESALAAVRERMEGARIAEKRLADRMKRIEAVRESYKQNQTQLRHAKEMAALAATFSGLERQSNDLIKRIADLQAKLETDERFRREIDNGFCPVMTARCLNIKPDGKLEDYIADRTRELQLEIKSAQQYRLDLQPKLASARDAQIAASAVTEYESRAAALLEEGNSLKADIAQLEDEASKLTSLQSESSELESSLNVLGDPKSRTRYLRAEMEETPSLEESLKAAQAERDRASAENETLEKELAAFRDLDDSLQAAALIRDETVEAYRTFVANESLALSVDEKRQIFDSATATFEAAESRLAEADRKYTDATAAYDTEKHNQLRADLINLEKSEARLDVAVEAAERRAVQLNAELERFASVRGQLTDDFREKERLETVAETTGFIRDTLKEAAPRVAKNYVYRVSAEANQLFREITGDADRSLRWGEDYSISLEEDGFERPFISLSGGEQMSAALSVRLALLKQLSDIRIAFFDEPTTNMDAERRENFAAQIGRVKNFDQLFVISHDETFDEYVDHHIHLERERRI